MISAWHRHWMAAICLMAVGTAHAGLFDDDEARKAILDLRRQISEVTAQVNVDREQGLEVQQRMGQSALSLKGELDSLRQELASLRGQNEQLAREIAEISKAHREQSDKLNQRMNKLEPSKVAVDGAEFEVQEAEKVAFDQAQNLFKSGDFVAARTALKDFAKRYPVSGFAPNGMFMQANASYALGDFKSAIEQFRAFMVMAPDHPRVPDSMLSLANSLAETGSVPQAKQQLNEVIRKFPSSQAASIAKERLSRLK